jgi:predicted amidohydrolase
MQDLRISLIQTELFWENKTQNLAHFSALIDAIENATDIIALPEMFTTGFTMQPELFGETMSGETVKWMLQIAKEKNAVITGSIIIEETNSLPVGEGRGGAIYFNRLIWAQPDGKIFHYDKSHLFTLSGEEQHYSAGKEKLIVEYKGWKICPLICYDLRFPVWCRNGRQSTPDSYRDDSRQSGNSVLPLSNGEQEGVYDLLLFVANWPERRNTAWKTLLQARAIENQAYVIGVNRIGNDGNNIYHSGDSSVIDPMGDVVFSQSDLPFVKTFTLSKERLLYVREKLPFLNDADGFNITI